MSELVFFSGTMDSGKSTLALQTAHNHAARGRDGLLFTRQDRAGRAVISSRLGLEQPALEVDDETDFWSEVIDRRLHGEPVDYVVADEAFHTPFARSYRVIEELPHREKPLRAALRDRGIGRLTIKKRGVSVVPDELRKRLALRGDAEGTIVLTRAAGQGVCLLVEPF